METVSKVLFYLGAVALIIMFILIFCDISLRLAINLPVDGTDVYASYLMVAVAFLALGYGEFNGAHVKMEFFGEVLFKKIRKHLEIMVLLVSAAFFTIMTWQIAVRAQADLAAQVLMPNSTLPLPVWWQSAIATAGAAMLVIALLTKFVRRVVSLVLRVPETKISAKSEKQGA